MPFVVYIAGPYTKPHPNHNVYKTIKAADELLARGATPIIPHLTHLWDTVSPKDYETWMQYDFDLIKRCADCLLRLPGESAGADREAALAKSLGIPVYYSVEEVFCALLTRLSEETGAYN